MWIPTWNPPRIRSFLGSRYLRFRSNNSVFGEPVKKPLPAVICMFLAICGPIIGMKPVRSLRIKHDLAWFACNFQGFLHLFYRIVRNSIVGSSVKSKHRGLEVVVEMSI